MSIKYFITGTDTNVGKTYISTRLLKTYNVAGYSTLGIKPISSGGDDDAILLQQASSIKLPMQIINPISFAQPIAPHIAAKKMEVRLSVDELVKRTQPALDYPADVHLIEGAGGFLVPLNETETMADFVKACELPVILVIAIRLGCINHALLTVEAIKNKNIEFAGWIANRIDPTVEEAEEIIESLKERLPMCNTLSFAT